jgi:hypothetical protein
MAMIDPSDHNIEVHNAGHDDREVVCSCSWTYTVTDERFIQSVVMRHKIDNGILVYDNNRKQWVEVK